MASSLRTGEEGFCWITLWTDEAGASKFADLYRGICEEGSVTASGRRAVATAGGAIYRPEIVPD